MAEYPTYLIHYGTPGQKWGVRKYQNEDGSLTPEGREHYGYGSERDNRQLYKKMNKIGKHTKVNEYGVAKNNSYTDQGYKKLSKNKAIQEAIKDSKLNDANNKLLNTKRKYNEPDPDAIMDKIAKKKKFDYKNASDEEWEKLREQTQEQYNKELNKFKELDKKDPQTLAWKEYNKEVSRVASKLAASHANDKIGDITYQKHLEKVLGIALVTNNSKKKK